MGGLRKRLILLGAALLAVLAAGTAGDVLIAGYSPFEAFYMALITITTVGYSEVQPLGRAGRIFNAFIVLFGVMTMFFAIGAMTEFIVKAQLVEFFGKRRIKNMIDRLVDHYIVCGYGRVGRGAAAELRRSQAPFVVLDRDPAKVERALRDGLLALAADATRDDALREAGILRAKGFIAALATDAENLFLILSAKALNPHLRVAARVNEEESEAKLRRAGADAIFRPYNITGFRLAQAILRP